MTYAKPDRSLTPGDFGQTKQVRRVSLLLRIRVYQAYRIPLLKRRRYTIDHLVPLELDGTNNQRNLWPQPKKEAVIKDHDENRLAAAVHSGAMTLANAQREILGLWG